MKTIAVLMLALAGGIGAQTKDGQALGKPKAAPQKSAADVYIDREMVKINAATDKLVKAGRIVAGADALSHVARYDQHSTGKGYGWFGAYTFSPAAFEQAKSIWIIDGYMLPGSDLLWISGRGVMFDKSVIGRKVAWMTATGCYADDGNSPCEDGLKNPGFDINLTDATIIDVFGHGYTYESWGSDGSHSRGDEYWRGPLRLNKKAPLYVSQWGIQLLPPDYVDMCNCTVLSSPAPKEDVKPCVQGGTLMPGESCSMSIGGAR